MTESMTKRGVSTDFIYQVVMVILLFCMLACMLAAPFVFIIYYSFTGQNPNEFTELSKYKKMLGKLESPMADHFPRSIPKDSTRSRIHYYYSFFGQGGTKRGELWMKPDPGEIDRLYAEFDRIKVNAYRIHQADKNYWINLANNDEFRSALDFFTMKEGNPVTTRSLEWHQQTAPISEDFTVFTLDCGKATHWDRGAAISKKRNEILYFAHINYAF